MFLISHSAAQSESVFINGGPSPRVVKLQVFPALNGHQLRQPADVRFHWCRARQPQVGVLSRQDTERIGLVD